MSPRQRDAFFGGVLQSWKVEFRKFEWSSTNHINATMLMTSDSFQFKDCVVPPKVMSKYLRIQDREVLDENFRAYDHSLRPYATKELLELPIQEVGKSDSNVMKVDPSQFVDHSILKELETTGFIDRMAAQ